MKRVLVIAYYFPPMGLSGVQRIAKFVKYLPDTGWAPTVLTVEPAGYFAFDEALLAELERPGITIERVKSIDPTRFFRRKSTVSLPAEGSRKWMSYLSQFLFIPDNKIGWKQPALAKAEALHASAPFDAVFVSIPPYTSTLIAEQFSTTHQLPLIIDYRDDWLGNPRHVYPTPLHQWLHERLERKSVLQADALVTINDRIAALLFDRVARYAGHPRAETPVHVIPQGFDPEDFQEPFNSSNSDRLRVTYSGVFYDAQTPDYFLKALAEFLEKRPETRSSITADFIGLMPRASKVLINALGLGDVVTLSGYQSHRSVIPKLQTADVLWMTVGKGRGQDTISTSKLFEYIGARKPILGLVPDGAARDTLIEYAAAYLASPDDVASIADQLATIYDAWKSNRLPVPSASIVNQFDRKRLTLQLGRLLDNICA